MMQKNRTVEQRDTINKIILLQNRVFVKKGLVCPFSGKDAPQISYRNIDLLRKYVSERGKILPSRMANINYKKQRELAKAIKRARMLALMPFVRTG